MRHVNFFFKLVLACSLFGFALQYQSLLYNSVLTIILIAACFIEKLTLFRFPKQGYFFAILLLMMFAFRAAGDFGNVLKELPFGVVITDQGLWESALFVSQVVLLFLLFGVAVYSTPKEAFVRYFNRINTSKSRLVEPFKSITRIAMYVVYLLPKSLEYKSKVSKHLNETIDKKRSAGIKRRAFLVMERIYQFMTDILRRSEDEYGEFLSSQSKAPGRQVPQLAAIWHSALALLILGLHAGIIWF